MACSSQSLWTQTASPTAGEYCSAQSSQFCNFAAQEDRSTDSNFFSDRLSRGASSNGQLGQSSLLKVREPMVIDAFKKKGVRVISVSCGSVHAAAVSGLHVKQGQDSSQVTSTTTVTYLTSKKMRRSLDESKAPTEIHCLLGASERMASLVM